MKILTQKNIIFHRCLLHAIYDVLVSDESVYLERRVDSVIAIVVCAKSFLLEINFL